MIGGVRCHSNGKLSACPLERVDKIRHSCVVGGQQVGRVYKHILITISFSRSFISNMSSNWVATPRQVGCDDSGFVNRIKPVVFLKCIQCLCYSAKWLSSKFDRIYFN